MGRQTPQDTWINEKFKNRIFDHSGSLNSVIDTIKPEETHQIRGKMLIKTHDLSKQQIIDMGPVISGITIKWSQDGKVLTQTQTMR